MRTTTPRSNITTPDTKIKQETITAIRRRALSQLPPNRHPPSHPSRLKFKSPVVDFIPELDKPAKHIAE